MANVDVLSQLPQFREITRSQVPLAGHTLLKIGGPAEAVIEPREPDRARGHRQGLRRSATAFPCPGRRLQYSGS